MATTSETTAAISQTKNEFPAVTGDIDLDQQTQQQQNQIEKEIADQQALISDKIETSELKKEYASEDKIYQDKVAELMKKYKFIRRTRGDGNCFYRAFGFGYLETNMKNKHELDRFRQITADLKDKLVQLGYLAFTVEDVRDVVLEVIDTVRQNGNEINLMEHFCSPSHSDYFVAYLRLFTSAFLQQNASFFENFIEDGRTVKLFCNTEVEPMSRESDNIHITGLSKATGVPIRVIYMDHSEHSSLTVHDFPGKDEENGEKEFHPMITMLYRPGHYDLLYEH